MLRERFDRELARRLCGGKVRSGTRGMTLIEIMVVIAIIGIVAGAIAYGVITYFKKSKIRAAEIQIRQKVSTAINAYYLDEGEYPNSLDQLLQGYGIKEQDLRDPWKKELIYSSTPIRDGDEYQLCSGGPDKNSGGEDDICLGD